MTTSLIEGFKSKKMKQNSMKLVRESIPTMEEKNVCLKCAEAPSAVFFGACGHFCVCESCLSTLPCFEVGDERATACFQCKERSWDDQVIIKSLNRSLLQQTLADLNQVLLQLPKMKRTLVQELEKYRQVRESRLAIDPDYPTEFLKEWYSYQHAEVEYYLSLDHSRWLKRDLMKECRRFYEIFREKPTLV
jgi:hypothetical protein